MKVYHNFHELAKIPSKENPRPLKLETKIPSNASKQGIYRYPEEFKKIEKVTSTKTAPVSKTDIVPSINFRVLRVKTSKEGRFSIFLGFLTTTIPQMVFQERSAESREVPKSSEAS